MAAAVVTQNWKENLKMFVTNPLSAIVIQIPTEGRKKQRWREQHYLWIQAN